MQYRVAVYLVGYCFMPPPALICVAVNSYGQFCLFIQLDAPTVMTVHARVVDDVELL